MAPYTRTGSLLGATLNLGATDYYQINGTPISPSEFLTTSTTTWTVPTGVNFITAICIGGGGAGNQSGTYNGGGGGGGTYWAGIGVGDHNSTSMTSGLLRFHCTPKNRKASKATCTRMVNASA